MSDKPSYLGLLNAIAVAESRAHGYFTAWIATSPSAEVRAVLSTVAAREGEHGMSFAKRINELGYEVREKPDPEHDKRMKIAQSTRPTSRRWRRSKLHRARHRPRARHLRRLLQGPLDRHPHRRAARPVHRRGARLRAAAAQRATSSSSPPADRRPPNGDAGAESADRLAALDAKVDTLCAAVEELRDAVVASPVVAAGT